MDFDGLPAEARGNRPAFALRRAAFSRFASEGWWAHKESNARFKQLSVQCVCSTMFCSYQQSYQRRILVTRERS
jgi:hypothetical protein